MSRRTLVDILETLRGSLAAKYRLEREVGRGGMARVYLAQDVKHPRKVAIKVLDPDLASLVGADRFLREIRIEAKLQHTNILPLYDSGEVEGFLYYVMPYVEGESLRQRLNREKQLRIEDAIRITREVAEALSYAHEHEVVHRDVKPENILFFGAQAVLADFGIARAVDVAGGEQVTKSGHLLGTPCYMSPEQAAGEEVLDCRSDIYSLGCVLYEMLAGEPPFSGRTPRAIIAKHISEPPPSVTILRPSVPPFVERAIRRALEKTPADRFATATEFAAALDQTLANRLGVAADAAAPARPKIAVLPFNLAEPSKQDYQTRAIARDLIKSLSKVQGLHTIPESSVLALARRCGIDRADLSAAQPSSPLWSVIGKQLGADVVLSGELSRPTREADLLLVKAELNKVEDESPVWVREFKRPTDDWSGLVEELCDAIIDGLGITLEKTLESIPEPFGEARDHYQQARWLWEKRTIDDQREALNLYKKAVSEDPFYAEAWSGLADTFISLSQFQYFEPRYSFEKAWRFAIRAYQLDNNLPEALASIAHILDVYRWIWTQAEQWYLKAIKLNPRYANAHAWYADCLMALGRENEARDEMDLARSIEPWSIPIGFQEATLTYRFRHFKEANRAYENLIAEDPDYYGAYIMLCFSLICSGMSDIALEKLDTLKKQVVKRALDKLGATSFDAAAAKQVTDLASERLDAWAPHQMAKGYTLAATGHREEALEIVKDMCEQRERKYVPAGSIAAICCGLGLHDDAFRWLEEAYQERSVAMIFLRIDPMFDGLRGDPRFDALVKQVFKRRSWIDFSELLRQPFSM